MKFMLMMSCTRQNFESLGEWTQAEFAAHVQFMLQFNDRLKQSGELVLAEGLDVPNHAVIVRSGAAGEPLVTDGPFAESKEFLAGFWIVECASRERAFQIAAAASAAPGKGGAPISIPIEVRQVMNAPDVGS